MTRHAFIWIVQIIRKRYQVLIHVIKSKYCMNLKIYILLLFFLSFVTLGLLSCGTSTSRSEKEIISSMLEIIIREKIPAPPYACFGPPKAHLIVLLSSKRKRPVDSFQEFNLEDLDLKNPRAAWWYENNKLKRKINIQGMIKKYRNDQYSYAYWQFGIIALSEKEEKALVYVSWRGDLCGRGDLCWLRKFNGKWRIVSEENRWIS